MNNDKLVVISCVGSKIWASKPSSPLYVPAQDAYVSTYFLAMKNYAVMTGFPWLILSAKYGFLEPDHPICDYDVEMGKDGGISQETISAQVLHQSRQFQGQSIFLRDFKRICIIAAKAYAIPIRTAYNLTKATISEPLKGCRIGERIGHLQTAVSNQTILCHNEQANSCADAVNVDAPSVVDENEGENHQQPPVADDRPPEQKYAGLVSGCNVHLPVVQEICGSVADIRQWVWEYILAPNVDNIPVILRAGSINNHLGLHGQMPQVCGALRGMQNHYPVYCIEERGANVQLNGSNVWFTYTRREP